MAYSITHKIDGVVLAMKQEINASYKDLGAVCDAIRYRNVNEAVEYLEQARDMHIAVPYKRHNRHMGFRHELHGKKGKYPQKAAREVAIVLQNAIANARNKGFDESSMVVLHAAANKTHIERRYPSKGSISWGRGMYGRGSTMHSDLEYAKVEIGIAEKDKVMLLKSRDSKKAISSRLREKEPKAPEAKGVAKEKPKEDKK